MVIPYKDNHKDEVTVVISTIGRCNDIFRVLLANLERIEAVKRVLVSDNTLGDFKADGYNKVEVLYDHTKSLISEGNTMLAMTDTPYYLGLGDDVILQEDAVNAAISILKADPKVAMVFPYTEKLDTVRDFTGTRGSGDVSYWYTETGANNGHFCCGRTAEYTPVDERLKIYFGDTYVFKKILDRGQKMANMLNYSVWHKGRASLRSEDDRNPGILQQDSDIYYNVVLQEEE